MLEMKLVQLISRELRNGNKAPSTAYEAALGNDGNEAYYTGVYGAAAHKADAGNAALGTEEAGNPVSTLMIDVPRNPPIDVGYTAGLL